MVENLIEKLRSKGWTPDEIAQALRVMTEAQSQKTDLVRFMDRIVYWALLFAILVGNFVISIMIIPFIVFAPQIFLYPMVFLIAATFGALYDLILFDINKIEGVKQFMSGLLLPSLALINIIISIRLAYILASIIGIQLNVYMPVLIGVVYVSGFMAPFWFTQRTNFWERVFK
ncbi:MAG: hypothetical protein AABX52_04515 [Nanoarchaeota archaeon]